MPSINKIIIYQSLAFIITCLALLCYSRSLVGVAFSLLMGILSAFVVGIITGNHSLVKEIAAPKIIKNTFSIVTVFYGVLLISLLLLLNGDSSFPPLFQEWGNISSKQFFIFLAIGLSVFILPGFFILRTIDFEHSIKGLQSLVFSYLLSVLYTPIVVILSMYFCGQISSKFYLLTSLMLLTISAIVHKLREKPLIIEEHKDNLVFDWGLLVVIAAFIIAVLAFTNENAYSLGTDVWRIQGSAISIYSIWNRCYSDSIKLVSS